MPQYKVIAPGFFDKKLYSPDGKRKVLTTDNPFKKGEMPSWLTNMPKETATQKKKREALEATAQETSDEKAEQDQQDISDASFMGDGEKADTDATDSNNVTTL